MSDKASAAVPLSDDTINMFVTLVRAAEILASSLGITVSDAMRTMLTTHKAMQEAQVGQAVDALRAMPTAKKVQ